MKAQANSVRVDEARGKEMVCHIWRVCHRIFFKICKSSPKFDPKPVFFWFIVTLRGSARGSNLEALPQQGHIFPNAARKCPQPAKKHPNPSKFHPKLSPNLTQILPRPPRNRAKRPLGAHVGPMFEKSKILNVRNTSKSRPRASRRYPRPSHTLPKWGPRPSKIHFLMHFFAVFFQLQICVEFWLIFWYLSKAQHTKNNGFSLVKCYILQNCHL